MSAVINNRTKNLHLQTCLDQWMEMLREANNFSVKTNMPERQSAIDRFVRTFVPSDVTEDDISHYSNNLLGDGEFFESLLRELGQCASGERVESIQGDETKHAIFTLLPPIDLIGADSQVDIVRELAFISEDGLGLSWKAEA